MEPLGYHRDLDSMTDYCEHCSQPLEFHGTACYVPRTYASDAKRITDLEERVSQLERNEESRLSYIAKQNEKVTS